MITTRRIGPGRGESEILNYVRALEHRVAALEVLAGVPGGDSVIGTSRPMSSTGSSATVTATMETANEPDKKNQASKKRKGSATNAEV